MSKYLFYYDEANNVPKINENYMKVKGRNIFVGVFVGWDKKLSANIESDFLEMESKLMKRFNMQGEFKGQIISKQKHFDCGVNSFGFKELTIYKEYFDFLNRYDIKMHISVESQLTYIIRQLLHNLLWGMETPQDIYTLTKAIYVRQPEQLLKNILSGNFFNIKREILRFLNNSIREDFENVELKEQEIYAFRMLVEKLNENYNNKVVTTNEWDYARIMKNFNTYYTELGLNKNKIQLVVDNHAKTLSDFQSASTIQMCCGDSKEYVGIRIADIMASMLSKFFTSLSVMYNYKIKNRKVTELTLPDVQFVQLTGKNKALKFDLYKSIAKYLVRYDGSYYQFMHDEFADDQWCFIALLNVFNEIKTYEDFLQISSEELRNIWHEHEMNFQCQHLEKVALASVVY